MALFVNLPDVGFAANGDSLVIELGLKKGQPYSEAKEKLLKSGWRVDASHGTAERPPYGFQEVICGNGRMAVCSARFLNNHRELMLTMNPEKDLLLQGAWDDK